LTQRLAGQGAALLVRALALIESGHAVFTPQDESLATYTKRFEKEDGRIDWRKSAVRIHNLVRAAIPWPVAHCRFQGEVYRILETEPGRESSSAGPGTVFAAHRDSLLVATGEGTLGVRRIQPPGKRAMSVEEYLRGHAVKPGERFENL
ncbi:MAG: methionyl-tRNA formyltransferase, partial [Candidatus Hydrogenedentes bacterium]|nr:methionyl-tRNA formyltransferase [Candidatus Hydrogenedentota bacterium]